MYKETGLIDLFSNVNGTAADKAKCSDDTGFFAVFAIIVIHSADSREVEGLMLSKRVFYSGVETRPPSGGALIPRHFNVGY